MSNTVHIVPKGEREIVITRVFDAPRHLVFEALTVPALLRRWFSGPDGWAFEICDVDLRVGGAWHYVWSNGDGRRMGMNGVYREIDPPARIVSTEMFDGAPEASAALNSWVLEELGGSTTLTTTALFPSTELRDVALNSNMGAGVAASYARLDALIDELAREGAR